MDSIECKFCNWHGTIPQLEKNQHCPSCQSPTTKRYWCKHNKLDNIQGSSNNQYRKCKECLEIIHIKNEKL